MTFLSGLAERGSAVPEEVADRTCPQTSSTWAMASDFASEVLTPLYRSADVPVVAREVTCVVAAAVESAPNVELGLACQASPETLVMDTVVVNWGEPRAHLLQQQGYTVPPSVAHRLLQG